MSRKANVAGGYAHLVSHGAVLIKDKQRKDRCCYSSDNLYYDETLCSVRVVRLCALHRVGSHDVTVALHPATALSIRQLHEHSERHLGDAARLTLDVAFCNNIRNKFTGMNSVRCLLQDAVLGSQCNTPCSRLGTQVTSVTQ